MSGLKTAPRKLLRPRAEQGQDGAQYEEVRGFGVRITAAGTVAFIFNYRTRSGRQRRLKIGRHPAYSALHKRPAHDF